MATATKRLSDRIYDVNDRQSRVEFAAKVISSGCNPWRDFSTCFEMGDAGEVTEALARRIIARPDTRLARNIRRYIATEYVDEAIARIK